MTKYSEFPKPYLEKLIVPSVINIVDDFRFLVPAIPFFRVLVSHMTLFVVTELYSEMLQQLFSLAQPQASVHVALSASSNPKEILQACMHQLLAQVQRKDKELRDALQSVIDSLPPDDEDHYLDDISADEHFEAIKLACDRHNQPKLIQTALWVIEKLLSEDLLVGDREWVHASDGRITPPPESEISPSSQRIVMDAIVETVFTAVKGQDEEETQLLAIRCVLSCVLSKHRLVHGPSLMTCVRTCYLINKDSKSVTAQTAATAALTQMLSTLALRLDEATVPQENFSPAVNDWAHSYARSILNKSVLLANPDNEEDDDRGRFGWCLVCGEAADYFCRKAREPVCSIGCKQTHLRRLVIVSRGGSERAAHSRISRTTEYIDVLTVFKSLCKLSSVDGGPDPRVIKAKRLSLELIASIIDSTKVLRTDTGFLEIVKQSLFDSLLANAVSPVVEIFSVALNIFTTLVTDLRAVLLREIGIFIVDVLVYIIESPNCPSGHKKKVMEIFQSSIFSDPNLVLAVYQHFDCSIDERNVLELSVGSLHKLMTSSGTDEQLRLSAVKTVCIFVRSIEAFVGPTRVAEVTDVAASVESEEPVEQPHQPSAVSGTKQRKLLLQEGIDLFKKKPGKGVDFFILHAFIPSASASDIAAAFTSLPNLDKTAIGEFIGENKALNLECLYAIVDLMDFSSLELDQALRRFLSFFRLPGEAQKIDRIMEKFAERFVADNPGRYANADAAYVLAFAVIMLNTDLHSKQIKKKMTLEEFVRLGKNINAEIEIAQAELERLYRNIEAEEISLREDDDAKRQSEISAASASTKPATNPEEVARRKFELFLRETEQMIQKTKTALHQQRRKVSKSQAPSDATIKDVLIVSHPAILSVLQSFLTPVVGKSGSSTPLTSFDETETELTTEVIAALKTAVQLSIVFELETVKGEFFSALFQIAFLDIAKAPVLRRNTDAMLAVLSLATTDGNGLGSHCWTDVVKLVSLIDKAQLILADKTPDLDPLPQQPKMFTKLLTARFSSQEAAPRLKFSELERLNSGLLCEVDWSVIDSIFSQSVKLNPLNVLGLISGLIAQSSAELAETPARLYACQRLVEVADFNMGRIRLVWSKIWALVAPAFVQIAKSDDESVSMFAVDSLRQLAFKFMSKPELGNFHFQSEFMRPFAQLMDNRREDLIVSVIESLVHQVAENLKSGWLAVFSVLSAAAGSGNAEMVKRAVALLTSIDTDHASALTKGEHFRQYMQCLEILLKNKISDPQIVFSAVGRHIVRLTEEQAIEDKTHHWLSLFRGLIAGLTDNRGEVRMKILDILFLEILQHNVDKIEPETVQIFFRAVLIPWLDDLMHAIGDSVDADFAFAVIRETSTALNSAVSGKFEIFSNYVFELFKLNEILVLYDRSDKASEIGIQNVRQLALGGVSPAVVADGLVRLLAGTTPVKLLENTNVTTIATLPFNPDRIVHTCAAQLSVIQLIGEFVDIASACSGGEVEGALKKLLESLGRSKKFASRFNQEVQLRERYKTLGFMRDLKQLPGLLKQERAALTVTLKILFLSPHESKILRETCAEIVDTYVAKESKLATVAVQIRDTLIDEIEREIHGLVPLISAVILGGFEKMQQSVFEANKQWIFDIVVKLVRAQNVPIRNAVVHILNERFRPES